MQVENVNGTLYGFGGAVPYGQDTQRASSVTDRYQNDKINPKTTGLEIHRKIIKKFIVILYI